MSTLLRKFTTKGAYEGLWELLTRTYRALADGSALPVTANDSDRGEPDGGGAQAEGASAMRVLVTGANGFLGRHVVAALLARGVDVRAVVRPAALWNRSAGPPR